MIEEQIVPITNISEASAQEFKKEFGAYGWTLVIGGGLLDAFLLYRFGTVLFDSVWFALFIAPWLAIAGWYMHVRSKVQLRFWKDFAASRGWVYEENRSIGGEKAILFRQGSDRTVSHAIRGEFNGLPFSIFEYEYTVGSGKHKTTYQYLIFEVKFSGTFPHLYLNNISNGDYISFGDKLFLPKLALPGEFEKKFILYAPKQYEIEALEIFSPDVLDFFLTEKWPHDLELTDGELIIARPTSVNSTTELEAELHTVQKLVERLSPTLSRMHFAPVGDFTPAL